MVVSSVYVRGDPCRQTSYHTLIPTQTSLLVSLSLMARRSGIMDTMNKSLIWVGIGAIVIAAIAYFAFMQSPTSETVNDTNSQAKININAICEGALAYMSFENGAAAEAWVAECKEGKHPEAIKEWKQQNGITDA